MYRYIKYSKNVFLSVKLGLIIPLFPGKFLYYYNLFVTRFIRLLGGLSALFYISGYYLSFGCYIQTSVTILAGLYGLLMLVLVIYSTILCVILFSKNRIITISVDCCGTDFEPYVSLTYFALIVRIVLTIFVECIGLCGCSYIYLEIGRNIGDIFDILKRK